MSIYYIDRKTGEKKKEIVAGEGFLKWIYETSIGQSLLEIFIKRKIFSYLYGKLQNTRFSSKKITKFVEDLQIDIKEAEKEAAEEYRTFNDFFARKLKPESRPICKNKDALISPADGRMLAYENIDMNRVIQVKGSFYTLYDLIQNKELAFEYDLGTCIVIRLCPADYHRFHFPDSGIPKASVKISGDYYSVNPLSLQKVAEVYCQNKREFTLFDSYSFGEMILMEVGATCVGSIIQTYNPNKPIKRGAEKGYFKFGGSTVIMFLKKDTVIVDEDIIENTNNGLETKVNMGEKIGYLIK